MIAGRMAPVVAFFWSAAILAGGVSAVDEPPPGLIDRYHRNLSDGVGRYVYNFDCLLAGRQVAPEATGSWVRVMPRLQLEDGKGFSLGASFKGRIVLPHLRDRLEFIADNSPVNRLPGRDIDPEDYRNVNAGLRLKLLREGLSMVDLDGGFNLDPYPLPFVRLRLSHTFVFHGWSMELRQDGFWYYLDDGFGEMSQIEFTRRLDSGSVFIATSAGTWSQDTTGWEWEQTFRLWRELEPRRRSINMQVSFFGHVDGVSVMDRYQVGSTYRWNAWRPWLFFELTPQIAFPEDRDFKITPMVRLAMEITCGDY